MTAAVSASQAKGTDLRDTFHRLKARTGMKKAAMAVAHKILVAVFHMLQRGVGFADLGGDTLDRVTSTARPSAWPGVSPRSATTSCSAPKQQPKRRHDPPPPRYRPTRLNFRANQNAGGARLR